MYIGETGRKLETRFMEHERHYRLKQRIKSATAEHAINVGHTIAFDQSEVLATEDRFWPRKIKALLIKKHPNFNQDTGLTISDIWKPCVRFIQ